MIGLKNAWEGGNIKKHSKKDINKIKYFPQNIAQGVWIANNLILFEEKNNLPLKCELEPLNILNSYPQVEE